jgi:hypothetical protein
VAEDLGRFLSDEPDPGQAGRGGRAAARWLRKRRRSVGLAAAACATTVLVAAAGVFRCQAYQRSQLGHVNFRTTEPLATAEIFGSDGQVQQQFAIPNEQAGRRLSRAALRAGPTERDLADVRLVRVEVGERHPHDLQPGVIAPGRRVPRIAR